MSPRRQQLEPEEFVSGKSDINEFREYRQSVIRFLRRFVTGIWFAYGALLVAVGRAWLPNLDSARVDSVTNLVKWTTFFAVLAMIMAVFPNFKIPKFMEKWF